MKIVGISACPAGLAHTPMAAKALEKAGKALGYDVKMEQQGSMGQINEITKEEAQADGAELIEPTTDEVTYSDGTTDEVYGFDIPVEKLDEDFNVAIIGKKGTWYDHVVSVSNPVPQE